MELVKEVKELLIETANDLKGSARHLFLVRAVQADGEKEINAWRNGS